MNSVSYTMHVSELGMEPTEGAFELTKHSQVSSIAPEEFIDIALGNDFIPYCSRGEFRKREVNSGKGR